MAAISLVYTPAQAAAVQSAVTRINAARGLNLTPAQFIQERFSAYLDQLVTEQAAVDLGDREAAFANASPTVQAQVKTLLGIS